MFRRPTSILVLCCIFLILLAGCGSGGGSAPDNTDNSSTTSTGSGGDSRDTSLDSVVFQPVTSSSNSSSGSSSSGSSSSGSSSSSNSAKKLFAQLVQAANAFKLFDPGLFGTNNSQPRYFATNLQEFWTDYYNSQYGNPPTLFEMYMQPTLQEVYGIYGRSAASGQPNPGTAAKSRLGTTRAASKTGFDQALGVYYIASSGTGSSRIDLYSDSSYQKFVGRLDVTYNWNGGPDKTGSYPFDITVAYIPDLAEPDLDYELKVHLDDSSGKKGWFGIYGNNYRAGNTIRYFEVSPSFIQGQITLNDAYNKHEIYVETTEVPGKDRTFTIEYNTFTDVVGTIVMHHDKSGALAFSHNSDGSIVFLFDWNNNGAGTALYWNGAIRYISGFNAWSTAFQ